jgi:hypothetical protein
MGHQEDVPPDVATDMLELADVVYVLLRIPASEGRARRSPGALAAAPVPYPIPS